MAYYPKSQIKTNLKTSGDEFILSSTKEKYIGFYYEVSNGDKFSGKTPESGPNILLLPIPADQEPESADVQGLSEQVQYNRDKFIETCQEGDLRVMNTCFYKPNSKLATYRKVGTTRSTPLSRETHEQINYICNPEMEKHCKECRIRHKGKHRLRPLPSNSRHQTSIKSIIQKQHKQRQVYRMHSRTKNRTK